MAKIERNRIYPNEILKEIFMLVIQTSPQYQLVASALACSSWYFCAMEIIRPALRKGIFLETDNTLQDYNIICSFEQISRLNIMHLVPIIQFNTRETATMYENITRIWHKSCWAVIHIPFNNRYGYVELQRISNFLNSFELGRHKQLTRLALRTCHRPFVQSCKTANALLPHLGQFPNLSEIYLEWDAQNCGIINIFTTSRSIRIVTITDIDPNGIRDLATVINCWPSLQSFTLKYRKDNCILSPIINSLAESCKDLSSLVILANPIGELKTALVKLLKVCGEKLTRFVLRDINLDNEVLYALATLTPNLEELDISWDIGAMDNSIPSGMWSKIRLMRLAFPYGYIDVLWLLGILTNCNGLECEMLLSEHIMRDKRIIDALRTCTRRNINFNCWMPNRLNL